MEAKHALQKAEMERHILDLQQQVTSLRSVYQATDGPSAVFSTPSAVHSERSTVDQDPIQPLPAEPSGSTRFIPVDPSSRKSATLSESDDDVGPSFPQERLRRRNHHDNRCLTIQVRVS